jgi:hypothetical protein
LKGEVYLVLFLCGLGDFLTTYIALSLGYSETRVFGAVPFLSTGLFCGAAWVIQHLAGPTMVKDVICLGMVAVALSGFLNNLAGLLGVESLGLLG